MPSKSKETVRIRIASWSSNTTRTYREVQKPTPLRRQRLDEIIRILSSGAKTLRRVFYMLRGSTSYNSIGKDCVWLRLQGEIDWGSIVEEGRHLLGSQTYENLTEFIGSIPSKYKVSKEKAFSKPIEVWLEKATLERAFYEVRRPTNFEEVAEVLGCTIRHDQANKLILFAAGCLTFSDEDQFNILMSGESAGGKSYTAQEVVSYFPSDVIRWIGGASPSAFYHDENLGKWDPENHVLRVELRQKILIFLDQPGYQLMEKFRPLLSHDRRELLYKITDKSKHGALRTKNVVLVGFPTVIFCAAKLSLDEQED